MNLHEFQAKQILADYGVAVPRGEVIDQTAQLDGALKNLGGDAWVVKAQVHTGGRGKAGGVRLVRSSDDAMTAAQDLLGSTLVTYQTGSEGLPIHQLLIEETLPIARELYLSAVVDRTTRHIVFMASTEGGMDIEEVAANTPEKILTVEVNPATGLMPYQAREIAFGLGLEGMAIRQMQQIMQSLYNVMIDKDASLMEINPLIVTEDEKLVALDCKLNIDDNALFRQREIASMRDATQENERENAAKEFELNYIALDGDIGCMVNGAGLAMATMDLIQLHGGEPANFLDVGGGATPERVSEAFKLILSDDKVKAILVNIFGGIVRCDLIAEGIIQAVKEVNVSVPVVVRLEGTNVELGREKLAESGLAVIAAESLQHAAETVVKEAHA